MPVQPMLSYFPDAKLYFYLSTGCVLHQIYPPNFVLLKNAHCTPLGERDRYLRDLRLVGPREEQFQDTTPSPSLPPPPEPLTPP